MVSTLINYSPNLSAKFLLDGYANETSLLQEMTARYQLWHQSCRDLAHHQQLSQERAARAELLQYQLKELNEFNPQPGEFEQIDEEYKRLANSGQLLTTSQNALALMADGEDANLQSQLYTAKQLVSELIGMDSKLSGVLDMLEEATIQIAEASDELRHYCDRLDLDPNRLFELEQRISKQISLARKHHVSLRHCHSITSRYWKNSSNWTIRPTHKKRLRWR